MAFASLGASTPFITSTPSRAVTFALPAVVVRVGVGLGLGGGVASALLSLAVFSLAVFAELFSAMTGTAVTASTSRLDNHVFIVDIDALLARIQTLVRTWGGTLSHFRERCQEL